MKRIRPAMKRTKPARRTAFAEDSGSRALAAIICHELNNISVPLDGFAELAIQNTDENESVRHSLNEMRIAIDRLRALASDLENLAESAGAPASVAIGDCMAEGIEIEWLCSAATVVSVDPRHARRAIQSLAAVSMRAASPFAPAPAWSVSLGSMAGTSCAVCGVARAVPYVFVQLQGVRAIAGEAIRDPFGSARVGRAGRRLSLAVLVHSTHGAGGHILLEEITGSLRLAFPVGRAAEASRGRLRRSLRRA
jgi:hypothetical protein